MSTDLTTIAIKLMTIPSCQDGMKFLKANLRKTDLQRLARQLNIPIRKRDTIDKLAEKIVESTIGYRLRAAVFQHEFHDDFDKDVPF